MHSRKRVHRFVTAAAVLMLAALAGCPGGDDDDDDACTYGGVVYPAGARFPCLCNTCECVRGAPVSQTKRACRDASVDVSPMDAATACTYAGKTYAPGSTFPSADACNQCSCAAGGAVACTDRACPKVDAATPPKPDAAVAACGVSAAHEYGAIGGLVAWSARAHLPGGRAYRYQRTYLRESPPRDLSCAPEIPACDAPATVDARQVEAALLHADVQRAFASPAPILYGRDQRPVDGTVFEVKRATDGRSFLVGAPCTTPAVGGAASCLEIPAGVAAVRDLLIKLDRQQLATADCRAFAE